MNRKITSRLIITALFILLLATTSDLFAQTLGPNLLTNPSFEEGHYNQDGIAEITVPNGWRMHWLDGVEFLGSNGVANRPETVVWNISGAPPEEVDLFWRDGAFTLKIFKGWAPMYTAISQDVSGLEVGRRYRLVAPIFTDIIEHYDGGQKNPPTKLDSGLVRMGAGPVGAAWRSEQITYSPYWTAATVSPFYLAYQTFIWDFTATEESMTIYIEVGSIDPYPNNGFFMDALGLHALDQTGEVPPSSGGDSGPAAPPPPIEVIEPNEDGSLYHTVRAGDTLWVIAVQYAPSMGITPEEALPLIQERNNNPAFIAVGQELTIIPPDEGVGGGGGEDADAEEPPAADVDAGAAETPAAEEETAASAEATTETGTENEVEATAEPVSVAAPVNTLGAICVSVFEDTDADGTRSAAESLLADAAITLLRAGATVTTYVSDGTSEPHCFADLEPDTYQVQLFPPADYETTTPASWAVAVSSGSVPIEFGAQFSPAVAATAVPAETAPAPEATAPALTVPDTDAETANQADEGGFFSNMAGIVIAIAAVLIILAGIGVVLLRRS